MQHPLVIQIEEADWNVLAELAKSKGVSLESLVVEIIKDYISSDL